MSNVYQNINGNVNGTANAAVGNIESSNCTISNSESLEEILKDIRDKVNKLELDKEVLEGVNDDIDSLNEQASAKEPKITRIKKSIENIMKVVAVIPNKKEICDFILRNLEQVKNIFNI